MKPPFKLSDHKRVKSEIEKDLHAHGSPRLQMFIIVVLTGCSAFLSSVVLRHAGMTNMAGRYFVSIAISYLVFLLAIRVWIAAQHRREKSHWSDNLDIPSGGDGKSPSSGGHASSGNDLITD